MAAPLPPLDKIDPAWAWQPWRPAASDPWGRKWAAHLYRRAAFGAGRAELLEADRLGPEGTLDLLMNGRPGAEELREDLDDAGRVAASQGIEALRGWWLYRMLHGGHPLREKLVLFWHNHFATSDAKVRSPELMLRQNVLLREYALGKFGPFLQAVSRDPAMLVWLDSNSNVKGAPNENYARELMELFSLGVGNYTEKDVKEAARAFTGWRTERAGFRFDPSLHDDGPKTVLGRSGAWDGGDVVRIVLERPAAARFLVRKLYRYLVSENAEPPAALLEPLCESFRRSEYDVAGLVRTMLASRLFYSAHAFRQRVKSPVEFVLGAVQAVYLRQGEGAPGYQPLPARPLLGRLALMGQKLFEPPNVKGWPGGRTWLNTSTVLERDNFAEALALGRLWAASARGEAPPALDPARLLDEEKVTRPEDVVEALLTLHVPGGVRPEARARLVEFVAEGNPDGAALRRRAREAFHAALTAAEYQLA
ncbi:MAG: DUF1800 domain-containing protein [Gemmataceae bacterium]